MSPRASPSPALPVVASVLVLMLSGSGAALADALDDTLSPSLGAFVLNTKTTVRADGSAGTGLPVKVGTPIDVEHQLGIGDRGSFRLDGYWRFLERHKIRVMYFDESRSSQPPSTMRSSYAARHIPSMHR